MQRDTKCDIESNRDFCNAKNRKILYFGQKIFTISNVLYNILHFSISCIRKILTFIRNFLDKKYFELQ